MGAHEDTWWPIDGPARDGRMAWPPRKPEHRQPDVIKDVWTGDPETDKFWAKNEPVSENID